MNYYDILLARKLAKGELPPNAYLLKEASGSLVSFNDGADLPMPSFICNIDAVQDLHGYDAPWVGGAGKNKLKVTATTQTVNGVTFTVNDDGTITANGTVGANANINFTVGEFLVDSNSCIVNGVSDGSANTYYLQIVNEEETTQIGVTIDGDNTIPISANTKYKVRIRIISGVTVNNLVFKPMIRLATETDATYAPYSNICPISGHTGVDAWVRGKNWLSTNFTEGKGINSSGAVVDNSSRSATVEAIRVIPNSTYTVSYTGNERWGWIAYNSNNERIGSASWFYSGNNFTTPLGTYYVRFVYASGTAPTNVQLEIGETATTYKPYNPNSQTIQVSWQTEAGEVYGGYIDLVSGELTVTHAGVDLGTLTWVKDSSANNSRYVAQRSGIKSNSTIISNIFKPATYSDVYYHRVDEAIAVHDTYAQIVIHSSTFEAEYDADGFKTQMSGHSAVYELATPITYQLTPTQIKSLKDDITNAWCDTRDVDVEYFGKGAD